MPKRVSKKTASQLAALVAGRQKRLSVLVEAKKPDIIMEVEPVPPTFSIEGRRGEEDDDFTMDELNDFLTCSSNFQRVTVSGGYVNGRVIPKPETFTKAYKRETEGTEYADKYRKAELEEMMKLEDMKSLPSTSSIKHSGVDDIESECGTIDTETVDDVYNRYNFKRELPDLPIVEMKDLILKTIKENPIVVLEGATGCGKSTQVPQFILDEGYETGKSVNIIVTQPRRIAAISIAQRISEERGLGRTLPNVIGYQIGLSVNTCDDTRITYCTTGVLLEKLINSKTMSNFSHIILDEVHERSQDMDFLFIVIKKLRCNSPQVKIILMSATIEAADFAEYFSFNRNHAKMPAPIIKVDKKNNFKITEFFLDDLARLVDDRLTPLSIASPGIQEAMYMLTVKLIYIANRIDYMDELTDCKPTILIFLPGIYEIGIMHTHINESMNKMNHKDFIVVTLHSMITREEQAQALRRPSPGKRIIILATNIAESSITVPDVKYVINFCLTKNLVTDTTTNFSSLQLEWCSRSNCRQRGGRTGRTMDGRVYHLVNKYFYEKQMDESGTPEMCRAPLEQVVLKSKQLNMGSPLSVISLAMDRPTLTDIQNTILLLKETGALLRTCNGVYSDDDGDMTFIGHAMAALPVDIRIAKLLVLGHCYSVLNEVIVMGAGLTVKSIFVQGIKDVITYYSKKLVWSDGSGSDLFAILKAYRSYEKRRQEQENNRNWTERYFLNEKSLIEMSHLIAELTSRLEAIGIKERTGVHRAKWSSAETSIILKVVIAGSFYPNYFVRSSDEMEDRETYRAINGRNPCNTVFFSGFEEKYIRPLYIESIKKMLQPCTNSPDNMQVTFDEGNEKVFVTFKQTRSSVDANTDHDLNYVEMGPGQVCIEVYKALKLKRSSRKLDLLVMHPKDAVKYADKMKIGSYNKGKWECKKKSTKNIEMVCLPRKHVKEITGKITHYDLDFNRFWFRSRDEEMLFIEIQTELNALNRDIEPFNTYADVGIGQVVAAPYDGIYYRAKVLLAIRGSSNIFYSVMFMDTGLEGEVEFSLLRRLRGVSAKYIDLPGRVFECRLACVQPSELHSARYGWESTMKTFKNMTSNKEVCAEIYSVDNGVASVFIAIDSRTVQDILIDKGFARTADENFMSKVDHDLRVRTQARRSNSFEVECDAVADEMRKMMPFDEEYDVKEPEMSTRHIRITLKGPKSPLESSLYSCLHMARAQSKKVVIEKNSVNAILLEANPQDSFEKYVIAANVTENQSKTELTARETTIMPNIPGFGPLMAMIFSPYCEFFRDKYKSRFVAILCGLGQHPETKEPLYSEHDSFFNLDTEIDMKDIEKVNTIRFTMDSLLRMSPEQKHPSCNNFEQNQLTARIKSTIIELLEKDRPLLGLPYNFDIGWSKFDPKDVLKARDVYGTSAIFPFHNALNLAAEDSPERLEQVHTLIENNKHLHQTAEMEITLKRPIKCLLCHLDLESTSELKIHLYSRLHTDREKRISLDDY